MSNGQPDGARLLGLAREELLNDILPQLDGNARYRARLIANALKIAALELAQGSDPGDAAAPALADAGLPSGTSLRDALRQGGLDGDERLYEILVAQTTARRRLLG